MRQVPELDGLRAVAVVSVVLFHAAPHGLFSGGFVGVDLFFVLSAFLITGVISENGDLRRFYWHRFTRLMPALLFMLAGYVVAGPFVWPGYAHGRDALLAGLYLSDYSYAFWRVPLYLQHTWSLAIEEQFYLLWPLLMAPLAKARRPALILLAAYVALTAWRLSVPDWQGYYYRFDTHCTGLVLGAALFFAKPKLPTVATWVAVSLLGAVLLLGDIRASALTITAAEFGAAVLITNHPGWLAWPALVWLGKRSYAVYLWHFPIAFALRSEIGFTLTAAATLAASIGLASLSHVTVEKWGRRLRDRVERARRVQVGILSGNEVG